MINKESEILYYLVNEPWKKYTFSQLKVVSKKKSKSYMAATLKKLVNEHIIKQEMVGHVPTYSLNIGSIKAQVYGGFILEHTAWNKKHVPHNDLARIMDKTAIKNYVLIVTGSYTKDKQRKGSDIDIVLIIDDALKPKRVYAELTHACEMNIPPIHLYVFRNKEFLQMLAAKEANYGKEIAKNNLVLCGGQIYLRIIKEAIQNGFNG